MFDLKTFRKEQKITQSEICFVLDIAQPYVSAIEHNKRPLNKKKFKRLLEYYGEVVNNYMYEDEEEMQEAVVISETVASKYDIPVIPAAMLGGSLEDALKYSGSTEKMRSPIDGVDFAIPVINGAMAPEYSEGSRVLVKKINPKAFIEWGGVYVLDTDNGIIMRRIMPGEKSMIRCEAFNPSFPPFEISKSNIKGYYKVQMCVTLK